MTDEHLKNLRVGILSEANTLRYDYIVNNCTPFGDTVHGHTHSLGSAPEWMQQAVYHLEQAAAYINIGIHTKGEGGL